MKILFSLILFLMSFAALSATCTSTSRDNYSTGQVLTSTALNADFNQLVTKANAFDGGCVTANTLEYDALNTTQFAPVLKGVQQGCKVSYSSASQLSISKCLAAVNGNFVSTSVATTVSMGCTNCSGETTSTTYYVYISTGSSGTTLTPLILTTAPNEDGYDGNGNKVIGRFYNNASSDIDQYSIDQWLINQFRPGNAYIGSLTTTGTWSANTTYTAIYWREGGNLRGKVKVATSGAPTSASLDINLPGGLTMDTARMALSGDSIGRVLSTGSARDNGSASYTVEMWYENDTSFLAARLGNAGVAILAPTDVTQSQPFTWGANDALQVEYIVPIAGWSD